MTSTIQLAAGDGHRPHAYRADAAVPVKGGVVVLQEAFGVNAHIRSVCDDYAALGYTAIAPALYDRQRRNAAFGYGEADLEQARTLRRGLDYDKVLLDIDAAVTELRPFGRVGVVGYCVGGSGAWLAACRLRVDVAVGYYPSDISLQLDEQPRCPVMMHFAEHDRFIPLRVVEQFRAKHPQVVAYVYRAEHGFNSSDRSHGHDPASAELALQRTLTMFGKHIALEA